MVLEKEKIKKAAKIILILAVVAAGIGLLFSNQDKDNMSIEGFAFDTTYSITIYDGGDKKLLDSCISKCSDYEEIFSAQSEGSELYKINQIEKIYGEVKSEDAGKDVNTESNATETDVNDEKNADVSQEKVSDIDEKNENDSSESDDDMDEIELKTITKIINSRRDKNNRKEFVVQKNGDMVIAISEDMKSIIESALIYCEKSDGSFDITIEPVSSLWDFTGDEKIVPEEDKIKAALEKVGYKDIYLADGKDYDLSSDYAIVFKKSGMGIDLGGIAKGYIADRLKEYLKKGGVKSAVINLGGNVLCIGKKSANEDFRIGIQQPFADRNETVGVLKINDKSVVSSGIYERYFKSKGKIYHHILDPHTGYSYDNDLMAVTIISDKSVDGDGLSTTCFSLGKDEGMKFIDSLDGVYAMFITKDEKKWYSEGFEKYIDE